jgi:type 1 glutamine amidotransferase
VNVLLSLDRHPNTGEAGFYPLAWTRQQGKGRVFYTGPGHREDVVQADWFARHLLGGIRWALAR